MCVRERENERERGRERARERKERRARERQRQAPQAPRLASVTSSAATKHPARPPTCAFETPSLLPRLLLLLIPRLLRYFGKKQRFFKKTPLQFHLFSCTRGSLMFIINQSQRSCRCFSPAWAGCPSPLPHTPQRATKTCSPHL